MSIIRPLAHRMRPTKIEEVIGQKHVLGENKPIYQMVRNRQPTSLILTGPPGIGKTTIATAIAGSLDMPFVALNGVEDGKKEIADVIKKAKEEKTSYLLYIDEIHRLTKIQSESLLPVMEDGIIILISSTTESVYHKLPAGILSRSTVYELEPLSVDDISEGLKRALTDKEQGLGEYNAQMSDETIQFLAGTTGGDMRSALTALETVVITHTEKGNNESVEITTEMVEGVTKKKALGYNGNDSKYDLMSSFQKSIRGSDPNAALYYMAMLLESGDLESVTRRLGVICFEDVGLAGARGTWADVMAAIDCAEKVGLPEAKLPLASAVVLLCLSPKSNSAHDAILMATHDIQSGNVHPIPRHLRDSHYAGAKDRGNGVNYRYPHDPQYQVGGFGGWAKQQYLPDAIKGKEYYVPKFAGSEKQMADIYQKLHEAQNKK